MSKRPIIQNIVFSVFIVLAMIGVVAAPVAAQTPAPVAVVGVIPEKVQAQIGDTFDVAVEVANVADLYAIDVLVAYDRQAVEVIDQDPELDGIQVKLGTLLEPGFVIFNLADNDLGRLRMVMTQLNPATPKSGTGTLVVITFKAKALSAAAPVEVLAATLSSPAGQEISVARLGKASLEILAELPGPTNTPIPAQAPGTPMPTSEPPTPTASGQEASGSIPTFTPTFSLLNLPVAPSATQPPPTTAPPSSTPTQAPSPTPPATQTPIPAANQAADSSPAAEPTDEPLTSASQPINVESSPTADPAEVENLVNEDRESNFTWLGLLVAAILVGGGIYFYLRSRTRS